MASSFEYILSLNDQVSAKLHKIGVSSAAGAEKLNALRDKTKSLQEATKDFGGSISTLRSKIDLLQAERDLINPKNLNDIRKYNTQIKRLNKEITKLETINGSKFKRALKDGFNQLPPFLTNPAVMVGAAVAGSTKMAMGWEQGMAKINATAQLPQAELDKLSAKIMKAGTDVGVSLEKVPDAYEKIISQTGDVALSSDILESALKGSKAGFTDVDTVAGALAQTLSAVGKENTNAQEVIDTLFAAKRVGAGEFKDFAQYVPSLVASAESVGMAWQDTAGIFAYMTGKGQEASSAAMLIQNAFTALGKSDIQKGLAGQGISIFNEDGSIKAMDAIMEQMSSKMLSLTDEGKSNFLESVGLRDAQAKQAFMVLASDVDKLKSSLDAVRTPAGELDDALNNSGNTLNEIAKLWSKLQAIAIKLGGAFTKVLSPALDIAMPLIDGLSFVVGGLVDSLAWMFGLLSDGNLIMWGAISAITAYAVYVNAATIATKAKWVWDEIALASTKAWTGAQWLLNVALTANPIVLIIAGIAALVAAIVIVVTKTQGWGAQWQVVTNYMKLGWEAFVLSIKYQWEAFSNGFIIGINSIQEGWYKFKNSLGLGDELENNSALERIQKDTELRKKAIHDASEAMEAKRTEQKESWSWEVNWKKQKETNGAKDKVDSATGGASPLKEILANNTDTNKFIIPVAVVPDSTPATSTADKVIDLNNVKATASYSAIARKIGEVKFNGLQGSSSREAIEKTQNTASEKVNNSERVEKVFESKEKVFQLQPEKIDYMKLISDNVAQIAASLLIAGSLAGNIRTVEDSSIARVDYVQPETTKELSYGGKTINIEKFCEQIVVHVPEGSDKDEVVRLVSDEVINRIKEELS